MWDGEFRRKKKKNKHKTKIQTTIIFETYMEVNFSFCCQALLANQSMTKGSLESTVCRICMELYYVNS